MKNPGLFALLSALLLTLAFLQVPSIAAEIQVPIQVSPNTLVLHSMGESFTVHADIPFRQVCTASLTLNGLPAVAAFADNRGNLVVKFDIAAVKSIAKPPSISLTLAGACTDGTLFEGSATIRVTD